MTTRTQSHNLGAAPPLLISGAVLLIVANIAHPIDADPTPYPGSNSLPNPPGSSSISGSPSAFSS